MAKERKKNPAAVALGKLSAASMSPEERSKNARKAGQASGVARMEKLTPAQRKKITKAAAEARWERWLQEHPDQAVAAREKKRKAAAKARRSNPGARE